MFTANRFSVRFSNGFWKSFDSHRYTACELHLTYVDAVKSVSRLNSFKVSK